MEMIPIILEAGALNDVDIVEDWCLDTAAQRILMRNWFEIQIFRTRTFFFSNRKSHNVAKKEKLKYYERTINLTKVEIEAATLVDGQPVVKINFTTDKTMAFTDKEGNIVSGDGTPQVIFLY